MFQKKKISQHIICVVFSKIVCGILITVFNHAERSSHIVGARSRSLSTDNKRKTAGETSEYRHHQSRLRRDLLIGRTVVSQHQGNPRTRTTWCYSDGIVDNAWWWWMIWGTRRECVTRNDVILVLKLLSEDFIALLWLWVQIYQNWWWSCFDQMAFNVNIKKCDVFISCC